MNRIRTPGVSGLAETPLKRCVREELDRYFEALDGQDPCDLHRMVMGETEQALLQFVLDHTSGNQSRAAQLLGVNRGTLRKKLKYYGLAS
jgi:Fis family transcriptional regulator